MKFLVDECLSPELTKLARARGFGESSHVVWLGRAGLKDWELKPLILEGDWTFVTWNSVDFRGSADKPGTKGQYADVAIHAGLVCLNGPPGMNLDMQIELFEQALDELGAPTPYWRSRARRTVCGFYATISRAIGLRPQWNRGLSWRALLEVGLAGGLAISPAGRELGAGGKRQRS